MAFPSPTGPNSYIWNLKQVYNARLGNNWPSPPAIGFFAGGDSGVSKTNVIQYVQITSSGNTLDFGDLTLARDTQNSAVANTTRGIWQGGNGAPTNPWSNVIDYITIASTGNAQDFGDLTLARRAGSAAGNNSTRGILAGGQIAPAGGATNIIDFITMATIGNSTDFGDLATPRYRLGAATNSTRALQFGGSAPGDAQNANIDYITIATQGNSANFGSLTNAARAMAGFASTTRGCRIGGFSDGGGGDPAGTFNIIDFVTIATTGNATDFGDLTVARSYTAGIDNSVKGLAAGGIDPAALNVIDFVTIASAGNATDFGDLLSAIYGAAGSSSANAGTQ
jgi:hypothetical protein